MNISLRDKHLLAYSAKCVLGILLCALVSIFLGRWIELPLESKDAEG